MQRYLAGFIVAVGLIVLFIVLIVRSLISAPTSPGSSMADLTSYAGTATTVQLTIDSPVGAASAHHDIIINVGNYQATFTLTGGYDGQVLRTQNYPMSTSSYAVFLRALKFSGFSSGNTDPRGKDERGQCALGRRYLYEILDASDNITQHYWYTSCGSGTFDGDNAAVRQLFTAQIPDYSKLTAGVSL